MSDILKAIGGLLLFLGVLACGGAVTAAGTGVTALIIGVGLSYLGFVSMATAQTIVVAIVGISFVAGCIGTLVFLIAMN